MVEKTLASGLWPQVMAPFQYLGNKLHDWLAPASEAASARDGYEISVELPGVGEDDIDVLVEGGVLTVRGEKKSQREESGDTWYFSERQYGAFSRSFRLPEDADPEKVSADLRDGVLNIHVGRIRADNGRGARKIAISRG